ncbi:aflatoxin biosynthesis regulatory protein [Aspergillus udagawae]|uniref:Aflatoxin biosynthesis regulatory protein n=1 Tax=Aspergillus udagawae TaxID=91492 RepID=A0A8H3NZ31_9EURO|nr:aflatoxin biosynthesis regulatory protein [Aspergillus udagawae]
MAESSGSTPQKDQPQVKLRSACDRCSSNKVKCSQERPECQRCRSLNLPCHYSRSLRMGKPPRSRQRSSRACCHHDHGENSPSLEHFKPAAAAATTDTAAIPKSMLGDPLPSQDNEVMGTLVHNWPGEFDYESILNDVDPSLQPLSPDLSDILGDSTAIAPGHSQPRLSDCPGNLSDLSRQQVQSMSKMLQSTPHNAIYERLSPISLAGFAFPATGTNSDNQHVIETAVSTGPSPTCSSDHRCVRRAMETLDCLYRVCSSATSSGSGRSNPSVDDILQVNGEAMEAAAALLACPCIKDFCLLIILAIIPCKVLAGYQAVVNMRDPHIQVPAGEATLCRPIAVGAYTLDEHASRMVIIQVVLAKFVQTYIDTFCFDASKNRQGHCGLVYRTLGLFIQSRLGTTTDGLQERLAALVGDGRSEFK